MPMVQLTVGRKSKQSSFKACIAKHAWEGTPSTIIHELSALPQRGKTFGFKKQPLKRTNPSKQVQIDQQFPKMLWGCPKLYERGLGCSLFSPTQRYL